MTTGTQINVDGREQGSVSVYADNLGIVYGGGGRRAAAGRALAHVSFNAREGEIVGIIGTNGSGKTTLCKAIAGILRPDEGSLRVDGKVSVLFASESGFNKERTGRENVFLKGMLLGLDRKTLDARMEEIRAFSGIGSFLEEPVKSYSDGMKARLAFSVAALVEPDILIVDEALATGDLEFADKAADKMRELVDKASLVILVSHQLRYLESHCHRILWLEKGEIRLQGEPRQTVERYRASAREAGAGAGAKEKPAFELNLPTAPTPGDILIAARGAGVSYRMNNRMVWALRQLDLEIGEHEVVGVIGRNGSGKSTLCRLLARTRTPDEGIFRIVGETTAMLGLRSGFDGWATGKDLIYLNGLMGGMTREAIEEEYEEIVRFSELGLAIERPVKRYSSGMKARLGFSIAARMRPDILVIDEVLTAGDAIFRQKAGEKLRDLIMQARTAIIVTHHLDFVIRNCTRAIWLEAGKIGFDGDPQEAVARYRAAVRDKRG